MIVEPEDIPSNTVFGTTHEEIARNKAIYRLNNKFVNPIPEETSQLQATKAEVLAMVAAYQTEVDQAALEWEQLYPYAQVTADENPIIEPSESASDIVTRREIGGGYPDELSNNYNSALDDIRAGIARIDAIISATEALAASRIAEFGEVSDLIMKNSIIQGALNDQDKCLYFKNYYEVLRGVYIPMWQQLEAILNSIRDDLAWHKWYRYRESVGAATVRYTGAYEDFLDDFADNNWFTYEEKELTHYVDLPKLNSAISKLNGIETIKSTAEAGRAAYAAMTDSAKSQIRRFITATLIPRAFKDDCSQEVITNIASPELMELLNQ